jgi:antitoxin VapB
VALNIRNPQADRLAAEVAALCGETKTIAVIQALQERLQRLRRHQNQESLELARQLDAIAIETAQLPKLDARSAEEILGYDKRGLPC